MEIKTSFSSKLPHYELIFPSYCDYSGDLKEDGLISKELTIREFLEEYTGSWKATFTPGYGKEWLTYGESLSYDILEWAYNIMHTEIIKYLKKIFPKDVKILDCKKLRFFLDTAYDEVYDESITCDFFCYEIIFEFLKDVADIENMKVEDILNQFK